jgi:multiple sugar transport system ATP-binding protein
VTLVEPLGREILIRAKVAASDRTPAATVSIPLPPDLRPQVGDRLCLQLDGDRLFVFDPATGARLDYV